MEASGILPKLDSGANLAEPHDNDVGEHMGSDRPASAHMSCEGYAAKHSPH